MNAAIFERLRADLRDRREVVLVTALPSGQQRLVYDAPGSAEDAALLAAVRTALKRDQTAVLEPLGPAGGETLFVQPMCLPVRLVLVGAVHIAQPLSQMAALAGFEVTVIDPRTAFSTEARFPGVTLLRTWPGLALAELKPDRRTAIVTLTHDPKLDDPALESALVSGAFYVGSLGSGKTHAARLGRLRARGLAEESLARIQGPVGLKIGARSPAEIAVSILAQVIETLRREAA